MKPICEFCGTNDNRNHKMCEAAKKLETPKRQYSMDQLEDALMDVDDLMARAALPYFVVGDTAKAMVKNEHLYGDALHVGVRRAELIPNALSTINTHQPELQLTGNEDGFSYIWNDTLIFVHYIDSDNELFKRPDKVWHNAWEYQIPNPWKDYEATL